MVIKVRLEQRRNGRSAVLYDDGVLAAGQGAVLCAAARKLIKRGHDPADRLEAWRAGVICLTGPLRTFAQLTVEDGRGGRLRFRPYRPRAWGGLAARGAILAEAAE